MICSEGDSPVCLAGSTGWDLWTEARAPSSILWHSRPGPESRNSREHSSCFSRMFQIVSDTQEQSSVKARVGSIDNRRCSRSLNASQQQFTQNEWRGELGYTNYRLVIKY